MKNHITNLTMKGMHYLIHKPSYLETTKYDRKDNCEEEYILIHPSYSSFCTQTT